MPNKKELEKIAVDMAQIYFNQNMDTTDSIIAFVVSIDEGHKIMVVPRPDLEGLDWKKTGKDLSKELAARGHEVTAALKINIHGNLLMITIIDSHFNHYFDVKEYSKENKAVVSSNKIKEKWKTIREAKKTKVCDMFLLDIFYSYVSNRINNYIELDKKKN